MLHKQPPKQKKVKTKQDYTSDYFAFIVPKGKAIDPFTGQLHTIH